jgi:hypothetical protein
MSFVALVVGVSKFGSVLSGLVGGVKAGQSVAQVISSLKTLPNSMQPDIERALIARLDATDIDRNAELSEAADLAGTLFSKLSESDEALIAAFQSASANEFYRYVIDHFATSITLRLSSDSQVYFEDFVGIACQELYRVSAASDHAARATLGQLLSEGRETRTLLSRVDLGTARLIEYAARTESRFSQPVRPLVDAYLATIKALAITDRYRAADRSAAFTFATQDLDRWKWWQAEPWAGKTTLMADLVERHPRAIEVAAFFIIGRDDSLNGRASFLTHIIPQLASIAGRPTIDLSLSDPLVRMGQFHNLLREAARACLAHGTRMLLLVDGLDEDRLDGGSIAAAIPAALPEGLNVLVTSRNNPPLHVPYGHPLSSDLYGQVLKTSPMATQNKTQAMDELNRMWVSDALGKHLLCLASAAGAPLSVADLAELATISTGSSVAPAEVSAVLDDVAARVFHRTPTQDGQFGYRIGHDLLDQQVVTNLDPASSRLISRAVGEWEQIRRESLSPWRMYIIDWIGTYSSRGWPLSTPWYASVPYPKMLAISQELPRLTRLVLDRNRGKFLLRATGTQLAAHAETIEALRSHASAHLPDFTSMLRLSIQLEGIERTSGYLPNSILSALTRLGDLDVALSLAETVRDPYDLGLALGCIAEELAETDPERAMDVTRSIASPEAKALSVLSLVRKMASSQPARAEAFARDVRDPQLRSQALTGVAQRLAVKDPEAALDIVRSIPHIQLRGEGIINIASALVTTDEQRAMEMAGALLNPSQRQRALCRMTQQLAKKDTEAAMRLGRRITDQRLFAEGMIAVAQEMVGTDPAGAIALARTVGAYPGASSEDEFEEDSESTVARLERGDGDEAPVNQDLNAWALTCVAACLVGIDAPRAIELVHTIADPIRHDWAVAAVSIELASSDPSIAIRMVEELRPPSLRSRALMAIAQRIALSRTDLALEAIDSLDDETRAEALIAVAMELAGADPDRARGLLGLAQGLVGARSDRQVPTEPFQWPDYVGAIAAAALDLASVDPDRALAMVQVVPNKVERGRVLGMVASHLAALAPGRALELARSMTGAIMRDRTMGEVAFHLSPADPEQALELARGIEDPAKRAYTVARIAIRLSHANPLRSLALAGEIPDLRKRETVLVAVATRLAETDPDQAIQIAYRVPTEAGAHAALWQVMEALAYSDIERSLQLARSICRDPEERYRALKEIATRVARDHPGRAFKIVEGILSPRMKWSALHDVVAAAAVSDPASGMKLARHFEEPEFEARIMGVSALSVVATDAVRAMEIADGIDDRSVRAHVKRDLAKRIFKKDRSLAIELALTIPDAPARDFLFEELVDEVVSTDPLFALEVVRLIGNHEMRQGLLSRIANVLPREDRRKQELLLELLLDGAWGFALPGLVEMVRDLRGFLRGELSPGVWDDDSIETVPIMADDPGLEGETFRNLPNMTRETRDLSGDVPAEDGEELIPPPAGMAELIRLRAQLEVQRGVWLD